MKRLANRALAALGLVCIGLFVTGLTGCEKKEVPVPHADPNNNSDEGKGNMPSKK
jgi:hypothetical protein